jgi:hypothetical protein
MNCYKFMLKRLHRVRCAAFRAFCSTRTNYALLGKIHSLTTQTRILIHTFPEVVTQEGKTLSLHHAGRHSRLVAIVSENPVDLLAA